MSEVQFTTISECYEKIMSMKELLVEFEKFTDIKLPVDVGDKTQIDYIAGLRGKIDFILYRINKSIDNLDTTINELIEEFELYENAVSPVPKITIDVEPKRCSYWDYQKHDLSSWNGHTCGSCTCLENGNSYDAAKYGVMVGEDRYCMLEAGVHAALVDAVREGCEGDN